ncbi:hypothetical protein [Halobaculum sp. MBLA0143]|uniref:hypothetical protein n=1 Tax=Halobaculum sp. MBLA0143 TaxID=3079933 RepID=UPI003526A931
MTGLQSGEIPYETQKEIGSGFYWTRLMGFPRASSLTSRARSLSSTSESEAVNELESIVSEYGSKNVLTLLRLAHAVGDSLGSGDVFEEDVGLPPKLNTYMQTVVASFEPSESAVNQSTERAVQYFKRFPLDKFRGKMRTDQRPLGILSKKLMNVGAKLYASSELADERTDYSDIDKRTVSAAHMSETVVGRLAYPQQYVDAMKRYYSPYDWEFQRELGFSTVLAAEWAERIVDYLYEKIEEFYLSFRQYQENCLRLVGELYDETRPLSQRLQTNEYASKKRGESISWARLVKKTEDVFWVSKDELISGVGPDDKAGFQRFLDRISRNIGEYKCQGFLGRKELEAAPMIRTNGSYLLPHPMDFARSMFKTFYYDISNWIKSGDTERDRGEIRGDVTESIVEGILSRHVDSTEGGRSADSPNVDEIDYICQMGETVIVFEAKATFPSQKVRTGTPEEMYKDVSKDLSKAVNQAEKRISQIQSHSPSLTSEAGEIEINWESVSQVVPVVVTAGQYDRIATLDHPKIIESSINPLVLSIFDLDVISRALDKHQIPDYIFERVEAVRRGQYRSLDEKDYLGTYLSLGSLQSQHSIVPEKLKQEIAETEGVDLMLNIGKNDIYVEEIVQNYGYRIEPEPMR